jgi:hypothetical protein
MFKNLTGLLGVAQGVFGLLGTASGDVSSAVGTGTPGNIFNLVSGAALGALGFGTPEKVQKVGVPVVSGLNALMGILGVAGVQNIGGLQLNQEALPNIINIGIAVLGFLFTFLKGKAAKK